MWRMQPALLHRGAQSSLPSIAEDRIFGSHIHVGARIRSGPPTQPSTHSKTSNLMEPRGMKLQASSWHLVHFMMGAPKLLRSKQSKMTRCPACTKNIVDIWLKNIVRSRKFESYITAPTITFVKLCTSMVFSRHLTRRHQTPAQFLVAKVYAPHCVKMTANIAQRSTSGTGATCMVWASILQTWHKNLTGMCLSLKRSEAAGGVA